MLVFVFRGYEPSKLAKMAFFPKNATFIAFFQGQDEMQIQHFFFSAIVWHFVDHVNVVDPTCPF